MSLKRARDNSFYPTAWKSRRTTQNYPVNPKLFSKNGRSNTSYRSNYSTGYKKGPYRVLTSGNSHTNPIYPKPECKIYDADHKGISPPASAAASILNTGSVFCLNQMITGTGVQQFTGNQVSMKSLAYRFEVDLGPTPLPTSGRVLVVWDKQPNGTTASWTDIFASASYLAFGNVNSRERFVILRNDQFSLSPQGDQTLFFEKYVKLNMLTTFVNGQASAAVPLTGALLVAYIADQATTVNQPLIAGWFRVRYFDN